MTISGPAPMIMAMYIAGAETTIRAPKVIPKLRERFRPTFLKEVQAQNETIFPIEPSLRFLTDMGESFHPDARNASLVSDLDQRFSHWRSRFHSGATGRLHPLKRFCVRGIVLLARNPG